MTTKEPRNVMDTREAAEYIGESPRTLEGWRQKSKALAKLIGPVWFLNAAGKVRYKRAELDHYMQTREVDPSEAFTA